MIQTDAPVPPFNRDDMFRGVKDALPVVVAFVPFALLLGNQAVQKGLTVGEVPLLTGLNFGGGSEFAALTIWTDPPHALLILCVTLLVNSRHFLMGAAFAPYLQAFSRRQVLPWLFFMCDESWAMALAKARRQRRNLLSPGYYLDVALPLYTVWVSFTLIGALTGHLIKDPTRYALDMAFPAVFLMLLRGMWKGPRMALPWLVSLGVAVMTYLLIPDAWYVPAGSLSGIVAAWLMVSAR